MLSFIKELNKEEQSSFSKKKLNRAFVKTQQILADALQKQAKKFSTKTLYVFLAGFCICFGTAFIRIAINAINDNHAVVFADPEPIEQPGALPAGKDHMIRKGHLDSLNKHDRRGTIK